MIAHPRIAPATELDPEVEAAITAVMRGNPPLVLFTTLARDKRLFGKFFGGGLLDRGHLTLRQREIVIDRTTALNHAEYEWGVHVATYGGAADLTREQIVSLTTGGPDDPCWTEAEATLIRLADALHHEATVDERSGRRSASTTRKRQCSSCCCSPGSTARPATS